MTVAVGGEPQGIVLVVACGAGFMTIYKLSAAKGARRVDRDVFLRHLEV